MPVPNSFASATTSIPLSQLDQNFNTPITLGNTAIQLGNTVTTLNNMTLANATVSSGNVTVTSASLSGNLTFTGTGNRIIGDFTNATVANRVAFQTSTANSATSIYILPNGTSVTSQFVATNNSDPTNASVLQLQVNATDYRIVGGITGTGTYLPMTFYTGGSERMRLDTSGNVGIGTSSPGAKLEVKGASATAGQLSIHDGTGDTTVSGVTAASLLFQARDSSVRTIAEIDAVNTTTNGTGGAMVFQTRVSDTLAERMRIDSSGNVGIGTSSPSAFGGTNLQVENSSLASILWSNGTITGQLLCSSGAEVTVGSRSNHPLRFGTNDTERARIDTSGNLLVGTTTSQGRLTVQTATATAGTRMVAFSDSNGRFSGFYEGADGTGFNAANTVLGVRSTTGTGRSINASGTVNASGADYAEYMLKSGDFTIAKGDICGINSEGKLTNVFAEAVTFVVKSTNPSYVGGDTWGVGIEDLETLEAARQAVDRIAFAGQVPVNVLGTTSGQYIIPVNENGVIKGKAVSNPTFEQYQIAVGKVIAIEEDGRARIIVKVA